jgi:acyl-coenzyme A synthetase/AMP-(fatty) acid ligase
MKWGSDIPAMVELSNIRLLGSVGEPINPEAFSWYRDANGAGPGPVGDAEQEGAAGGADEVAAELRAHVAKEIGPIARPRQILVVAELPKTRSGKIMRRLLRDVAEHRDVGDVTTLADSKVMDLISNKLTSGKGASED